MTDDEVGRPLRDLGRWAVVLVAHPLAAYLNSGGVLRRYRISRFDAAEVRTDARRRPPNQLEAASSTGLRFLAWLGIGGVSLSAFLLAVVARTIAGRGLDGLLVPVMAVTVVTGLLASASLPLHLLRLTIIRTVGWRGFPAETFKLSDKSRHDKERHRRVVLARRGQSRVIRWMSTPSLLDAVPVVIWTLMFAPLVIADIVR